VCERCFGAFVYQLDEELIYRLSLWRERETASDVRRGLILGIWIVRNMEQQCCRQKTCGGTFRRGIFRTVFFISNTDNIVRFNVVSADANWLNLSVVSHVDEVTVEFDGNPPGCVWSDFRVVGNRRMHAVCESVRI